MQTLRKFDEAFMPFLEEGGRVMFQVFAGVALLICFIYQWATIRYPYSMDYGEAPLVDQAMRLANGENIYRADISTPPYTISNYPPLYVAALALGVKLFGPAGTFTFGRLLSAVCAWLASYSLARLVGQATGDRLAGFVAGALLLAFPFVMTWSPLLRIDLLALALSLAGLCLLVTRGDRLPGFTLACGLIVAAIFTRQSYALAAPLAGFTWLLGRDWKQALRFAGLVGGTSLVLFLVLNVWTSGGFFFNIVTANVNEFKVDILKYNATRFQEVALTLLLVGAGSLFLSRRLNPLAALSTPYLIGALLSALTIGKVGSNVNYLLEFCAALSLAAGAVVAWSRAHLSSHTLRAGLLFLLVLGVGRMLSYTLKDYTSSLRDHQQAETDLYKLEALVKKFDGPVLADEYMGMLTLLGRPLSLQPFEVTQLALAGKWDQTPLLESIQAQEFDAIVLYDQPWSRERWTPEMLETIEKSYSLSAVLAGNRVYVPYKVQATEALTACPGAPWQLPSDSRLGVKWEDDALMFYGRGNAGQVPVYAVADGLLWRLDGWTDTVLIQHDDPLEPGQKTWTVYRGMLAANGEESLVARDFPPGSRDVPVKAGQLLGYQGPWSGDPQWPTWLHVYFAVVRGGGGFPEQLTSFTIVNPSPYLGLALRPQTDLPSIQSLICGVQ